MVKFEERGGWICGKVYDLSTGKSGILETSQGFATTTDTWVKMEKHHDRLYIEIT